LKRANQKLPEAVGVLTREIGVRVLNLSASGCLIETTRRVDVGTIATLRIALDTDEYHDDVQVVRCHEIEGAGPVFHVGVQYIWTAVPHARSLRTAVRDIVGVGAQLDLASRLRPN
jgi:PilZ domain